MTLNDFQRAARRTYTSDKSDTQQDEAILGLCGEVGELADIMKKSRHQGHEYPRIDYVFELGDVLYYCALMADGLGYSLEDVAKMNIEKRRERYPEGFSVERSVNRDVRCSNNKTG